MEDSPSKITIQKSKKPNKFIILSLIIILLAVAIGLIVYGLAIKTKNEEKNTPSTIMSQTVNLSGGLNYRSKEELNKISNSREKFDAYVSQAQLYIFSNNYELAFAFYKEALAIEGVDVEVKKSIALQARGDALYAKRNDMVEYFSSLLTEEDIRIYEQSNEGIE